MITTYFKPSIHGWPFHNKWKTTIHVLFFHKDVGMGFCGGMCWRALQRFYDAIPIPRDTPAPNQGDPLYDEILTSQLVATPESKILKFWDWQTSPDLGHWNRKHSIGHLTLQEWPEVKRMLDNSKPVTLSLIAHSNDYNPIHLSDHHRVVAYAYDELPVTWDDGPENAHTYVTIYIYDPDYHDNDDVFISFYLGGDQGRIRFRHNQGEEYHGFFLDTENRNYTNSEKTDIFINKCTQTGINEAKYADYDLVFSWQCRFIPYFRIQVDGTNWQHNAAARATYFPAEVNNEHPNKQCSVRTGSMTVPIKLPRFGGLKTKVAVGLLNDANYYKEIEVDVRPAIKCYPYINVRSTRDTPQICDTHIQSSTHLFIKDSNPTQQSVQQLDTSPFRWVINETSYTIGSRQRQPTGSTHISVTNTYQLGNVKVPILANFEESNFPPNSTRSADVKIYKQGRLSNSYQLTSMSLQAQNVYNGFLPADYDDDTKVEFTYYSTDQFGVTAQGQAFFHGQSIINFVAGIAYTTFDPEKLTKLEAIAYKLLELGLIDTALGLTPGRTPAPDPEIMLGKLRANTQIGTIIDGAFKTTLKDPGIWKESLKVQSDVLVQVDRNRVIPFGKEVAAGTLMKQNNEMVQAEQDMLDAVVLEIMTNKTIVALCRNSQVIKFLKTL